MKPKEQVLQLQSYGLPVKDQFPELQIRSMNNRWLREELDSGKPAIMLFTSAGCSVCNAIYPVVSGFAENHDVNLLLFVEGNTDAITTKITEHAIRVPVFHADQETLTHTKVNIFPFAYYVSRDGTICAKGGIPTGEMLDLLLFEGSYMERMLSEAS
jgi:thiol-disulfide isomerase/thioredoxin